MKYFKRYKNGSEPFEISKESAMLTLDKWVSGELLKDIFENSKEFRLCTPMADVWTSNN